MSLRDCREDLSLFVALECFLLTTPCRGSGSEEKIINPGIATSLSLNLSRESARIIILLFIITHYITTINKRFMLDLLH